MDGLPGPMKSENEHMEGSATWMKTLAPPYGRTRYTYERPDPAYGG